jgi:hypothetical protein
MGRLTDVAIEQALMGFVAQLGDEEFQIRLKHIRSGFGLVHQPPAIIASHQFPHFLLRLWCSRTLGRRSGQQLPVHGSQWPLDVRFPVDDRLRRLLTGFQNQVP